MGETFGTYLRAQRLRAGFGLRAFAEAVGMQPSNLSNLEHDRLAAPQDKSVLDTVADLLSLAAGSEERARLFDLAAAKHRPPADVADYVRRTPGIPVLLRTIENRGLKKAEIERLTEYINRQLGRA